MTKEIESLTLCFEFFISDIRFFSLFGTRKQNYFCFKVLDKNYYEMKLIVIIILCEYTLNVKRNLRDIHILQDMQSNFPEEVSEYSVNCKATTDRALL